MDLEAQLDPNAYPDPSFDPSADDGAEQEPIASQEIDFGLHWNEEKRRRLGRRVTNWIRQYLAATAVRRANLKVWRANWELMPEPESDEDGGPWPNSSQIPAADTRRTCNAHHTRLNQQILLLDPPFAVIAGDDEAQQFVPEIEDALPRLLEEADWQIRGDALHQELPIAGNCGLSIIYDVVKQPKPYYEGDLDEEMAQARVLAGQDPVTAGFESLKKDAQGRVMRKLAFRQETVYQGVRLKVIPWEDMIILPVTVRDASEAHGIGERLMVTGEELRRGAKEGKYLQDAVDELLQQPPDRLDDDFLQALDLAGIHPSEDSGDVEEITEDGHLEAALWHSYLCFEMCLKLDGNDDGYPEWCWVLIHPATERILRLQYLPWSHGQPHYHHFKYLQRTGQLWGQGVAEMIATFSDGRANAINQQINWADLAIRIATTMLVDETAELDPDEFELELGKIIPVGNINGVKQLELPPLPPAHAMIPQLLKEEIDLLTGASDPALGKEVQGQHTLGEIQIAIGQGQQHSENVAASVARQWCPVWDQDRYLVAQYGRGEQIRYRKSPKPALQIQMNEQTGAVQAPMGPAAPEEPFGYVTSEMLESRIDLVPAGLQHMSDIQTRIQQAQVTYNTVMALPMVQADPRIMLLVLDYYLQQLRVPIRQQLMQALGAAVNVIAAQQATLVAQQQQQQAGDLGAQTAGTEGQLQAELAQQGIGMPEHPAAGMNGAAPPPMALAA